MRASTLGLSTKETSHTDTLDPLDHFKHSRVEGAYDDSCPPSTKPENRGRSPRFVTILRRTDQAVENLLRFYEGRGRLMRASTLGLPRTGTSLTDIGGPLDHFQHGRVEGAYGVGSSPSAKGLLGQKQKQKQKQETYSSPRKSLEHSRILIQDDGIAGLFIGHINMLRIVPLSR